MVVETDLTVINGTIFVDGDARFEGQTSLGVNADVEINNADDSLRLQGSTVLVGPTIVGSGRILFEDTVNVTLVDTSIGTAETDLDGLTGNTELTVQPGVTFSIASNPIEPSANDGFDGSLTNHGTFSVLAGWRLDGGLVMDQIGGSVPTLSGFGPFRIHTTGTMSTDGDAIVNAPTEVAGTLQIGNGTTQVNNTASFESTANVMVASGGELQLNGASQFAGGSYTGSGLIQFNAAASVDADTTINTERVDLDGDTEDTHISLNNADLVLNVDRIDETNNFFGGTIDIAGNQSQLRVNLTNSQSAWRLGSLGTMNLSTTGFLAPTLLAGNDLIIDGTMNVDGRVGLAANIGLHGRLSTADSGTDVHLRSGGRNIIFNTATVAGAGQITNESLTTLNLEDGTLVGVDVENRGRLELGFFATEVSIDYSDPAAATIRSNFSQSSSGTFAVDLAGKAPGTEFDVLNVIGVARLGGALEASLIDGLVPSAGDEFQVLTALSVINEFASVEAFDVADLFGFEVTALYSPTDVLLRFDDTFLLGDFDDSGTVDIFDLNLVLFNWNQTPDVLPNDWVNQIPGGLVGADQMNEVLFHWGNMAPLFATVPEPASAIGLVTGWLLAFGVRRRRIGVSHDGLSQAV